MRGRIHTLAAVDFRDLTPQVRLDVETRLELDRCLQTVERGVGFGEHLERGAQRGEHLAATLPIRTRVAEATKRVLVIMDGFAIEIQDACPITRSAQVAHRALAVVASPEVERQ